MSQNLETFGKYILLEKLAMGGMAEVYLARGFGAGGIGKFVAIKRILPQFSSNAEFIDMFKAEAKIAINLSHSNIVNIFEFGVEKDQFFLVMDYVEGKNLRQIGNKLTKKAAKFSIEHIVYIIKEVAAGLDHAHRCIDGTTGKPLNITHRDISPQNVMVSFEGEVKVVDFGIAKAESQLEATRAGTLKGKYGYMSPEQAEGQLVDLRTDIFSLGIVMWELLTQERLFLSTNEIKTLKKIRDCIIPKLSDTNPSIPAELERIAIKMLQKDKNLRYQTAGNLHRDLNRFLNRQYPDFSPQDFSIFVKSLFSEDILDNRKKLVEYAQIQLPSSSSSAPYRPPQPPPSPERTVVASYNSTSKASSESGVSGLNVADSVFNSNGPSQESEKDDFDAKTVKSHTSIIQANANSDGPPQGFDEKTPVESLNSMEPTKQNAILSLDKVSHENIYRNVRRQQLERARSDGRGHRNDWGSRRSSHRAWITPVLFTLVAALGSFFTLQYLAPNQVEPIKRMVAGIFEQKGSAPLPSCEVGTKFDPKTNTCQVVLTRVRFETQPPGAKIYLDGKDTGDFTPYETELPISKPFRLGLEKQGFERIDFAQNIIPSDLKDGLISIPLKESVNQEEQAALYIETTPSNALVSVDGRILGRTPGRFMVSKFNKFELQISLSGWEDFGPKKFDLSSIENNRVNVELKREKIGYLDIDVRPPTNVKITIDSVEIQRALPISNLQVKASDRLVIRAENTITRRTTSTVIDLKPNQRKTVTLKIQ